ncbi:mannan endo-1,6-alpha-mannosidase [Mollisia scopiformis]|uniref:Mannan endo-1,6-alpha-mannosidase n=1 Tax=Mollisia scopiformis TaxID=149040 RepID=A0A194XN79_MOLSC|nr:mannan endo-1,6-alpha-mannosidase [Mollisia scopiformis]KUJ21596.1 mannan endo-1,6-alpha-mannosidase [Mollisia scopiformis]
MMSYYTGNLSGQIPGLLPAPYYWWEAGGMWGALVDYYHYTGDPTYNAVTMQALQFQVGPYNDFMPPNETASLGNDDQSFWALAALSAAETNFPNPAPDQPSWLALVQAVFNEQVSRWDTQYCNGGIRWQIYPQNNGYTLKNSISNGCLFNIASRLARYTGDDMYAQWAVKIWDWMSRIGLIDANYNVYDNSEADILNCTQVDKNQWVYNAGTMLMGASTMYNYTNGSALWQTRTAGLLSTLAFDFFPGGIMKDICEQYNACNVDEHSFKAYLSRWMAASTKMAPFTYNTSYPLLVSSAKAAAAQCNGSPTGNVCGLKWYNNGTWDGTNGVGQQMAALEVMLGTLIKQTTAPVTNSTGGTSVGNPTAGYNSSSVPPGEVIVPANHGDRVGAWFLTAVLGLAAMWCWLFMSTSVLEGRGGKPTVAGRKARVSRTWEGVWKGKGRETSVDLGEDGGVMREVQRPKHASVLSKRSIGDDRAGDRRSIPIYRGGDLAT